MRHAIAFAMVFAATALLCSGCDRNKGVHVGNALNGYQSQYGFSFQYDSSLQLTENPDKTVITLSNPLPGGEAQMTLYENGPVSTMKFEVRPQTRSGSLENLRTVAEAESPGKVFETLKLPSGADAVRFQRDTADLFEAVYYFPTTQGGFVKSTILAYAKRRGKELFRPIIDTTQGGQAEADTVAQAEMLRPQGVIAERVNLHEKTAGRLPIKLDFAHARERFRAQFPGLDAVDLPALAADTAEPTLKFQSGATVRFTRADSVAFTVANRGVIFKPTVSLLGGQAERREAEMPEGVPLFDLFHGHLVQNGVLSASAVDHAETSQTHVAISLMSLPPAEGKEKADDSQAYVVLQCTECPISAQYKVPTQEETEVAVSPELYFLLMAIEGSTPTIFQPSRGYGFAEYF